MFQKTNWVWLNEWSEHEQATPQVVFFRKSIRLDATRKSAMFRVSADTRYRFFVNGHPIGFGPCKGDGNRWYHESLNAAPYLVPGENVLSAIVIRFPAVPRKGPESVWRTHAAGFYLSGSIETAAGARLDVSTDESWKALRTQHIGLRPDGGLNFLWIREETDGSEALAGWNRPGFDDSTWETVKPYRRAEVIGCVSPGCVSDRPIPLLFETRRRFAETFCIRQSQHSTDLWNALLAESKPMRIPPNTHEIVEISAGELTTGFLELALANGRNAEVRVLSSECYAYPPAQPDSHHPLPIKGDRTDCVNGQLYGMQDRYRPAGYGTTERPESWEPFWFRTFRFLSLEIVTKDEPLDLLGFTYRETGYPLDAITCIESSDPQFADIWDISLRTLRRCMHETYEDCPFYEQLQYAMDTRSQILYTYAVSSDDRLARKCIDDFHRSQYPEGLVSSCYPAFGHNTIPGFSLYYLLMLHDHMMYFGDKAFLRKYLSTMDNVLRFFDEHLTADGIVDKVGGPLGDHHWSFVDWTAQWNATLGCPTATRKGPLTFESLLYAHVLKQSAEVADFAGRGETAQEYRERAAMVIEAVNRVCRNDDGMYRDGPSVEEYSQHCQVMAILADATAGEAATRLMARTLADKTLTQCSVAMAFYLFRAVEKTGLYAQTGPLWQPWRDMLANHLTTCVEDPVAGRSDCHAWGAIALYEFPSVVLGVQPAKPGYAAVRINPQAGPFAWAKGSVSTPRGVISVSWRREDGEMTVETQVPEGMEVVG